MRRHFGMDQQELAHYLGITQAMGSQAEAGRRGLGAAARQAPETLAAHLPPTPAAPVAPPAAVPTAPPLLRLAAPETAPLAARLDYCQHHARRLRRLLRPLEAQAATAARWHAARPALLATLPPAPEPTDTLSEATGPGDWAAYLRWYRRHWLLARPTALPPAASARYHLLRLQAEALETAAAALLVLLG
ncbi:helix-turn-helix domain-containing protein [Hymenobacter elongatus]|uniref:Uncharacterized protein n=1 Tax=Hymenobacter elongatus TaxID=877208 RepID=A0A4Z0PN46_9BACT|nr:hypothetical protein [Hymenobacter elongatus]TGE16450.1 hypothetical protein E5J99_10005 [Hymenobacter elongatus]